jgi:transcriptional regulator with XRE-family HTH domain
MDDAEQDRWTRHLLLQELVKQRKRQGLSQLDVAIRLHTQQSVISQLEAGRTDARLSVLQAYARVIGLRLDARLWAPIPLGDA